MAVTANPNIIMGFRAPEIQNPMALAAQGEQIRSARNQNAMAEATLAAAPAKAMAELTDRMVRSKKDVLGGTGNYEQANETIKALGGGADVSSFLFKTPEDYQIAKDTYFKQNKPATPKYEKVVDPNTGKTMLYLSTPEGLAATDYEAPTIAPAGAIVQGATDSYIVNTRPGGGAPKPLGLGLKPTAGGKPTEDQSKATGWLEQARFANKNMMDILTANPEAGTPTLGEMAATTLLPKSMEQLAYSADRQQFNQAASQFSEATLRAATGAGVTQFEAEQKVKELTPVYGDSPEVIQQKLASQDMYLKSLEARATGGIKRQSLPTQLSPEDLAAKQWAEANPNDPRAQSILNNLQGNR